MRHYPCTCVLVIVGVIFYRVIVAVLFLILAIVLLVLLVVLNASAVVVGGVVLSMLLLFSLLHTHASVYSHCYIFARPSMFTLTYSRVRPF